MTLRVHEIYTSLQGEGVDVGVPTLFLRLQGCNLYRCPCKWCDTPKARDPEGGFELVSEPWKTLLNDRNPVVPICITGGEPLLQEKNLRPLVEVLRLEGRASHRRCLGRHPISIETNGTLPPPKWVSRCHWCVDVKPPSSGLQTNLDTIFDWHITEYAPIDFKFVVANVEDLNFVRLTLLEIRKRFQDRDHTYLLSPAFKGSQPTSMLPELADFAKRNKMRLSLQLHKIIWGERDGV